jgi:hypothetical protein
MDEWTGRYPISKQALLSYYLNTIQQYKDPSVMVDLMHGQGKYKMSLEHPAVQARKSTQRMIWPCQKDTEAPTGQMWTM